MPVRIEVLRNLNQWTRVDMGPMPIGIPSGIAKTSPKHVVFQGDNGPSLIMVRQSRFAPPWPTTSETKSLMPGKSEYVEGILPGSLRTELIRITQE